MSVSGSSAQLLPLGLAGFGRVVQDYYLPVLRNMQHGKIVAIVDPRPEATALAKKLFPAAQIFFDHQSMFDQCKLDGILIATPPSSHFEIWQKAIKRQIPVFVEKPLILSSQIKDFPPNENPKIMIDFNRRFWPAYNRVRSLVQDGTF